MFPNVVRSEDISTHNRDCYSLCSLPSDYCSGAKGVFAKLVAEKIDESVQGGNECEINTTMK